MSEETGHGHQRTGDIMELKCVRGLKQDQWKQTHLLPRCGSRVLSVDRTHLGPGEGQLGWTWTWPPSWEWRPSRPAPPPAPPGAPATWRDHRLLTLPRTGNCGWGRRSLMTAGHMEVWLSRASIAIATVARLHPPGYAAGFATRDGANTD